MANHIDGLGGAERVANVLAGGLADRGYDVALRGIRPAAEHNLSLADPRFSVGFVSDRPERPEGATPWPNDVRADMRAEAVRNLGHLIEEYRHGLFICTQLFVMEHLATLDIERQLNAGTRIIGQYHSSYAMARSTRDYDRLSRVYRQIDKFLLLTETDARAFRELNFNNTGHLPNPLSMEPEHVEGPRENLVVVVARYDQNKQLDHALRAWSAVAARFPDWRLELYGDGSERGFLARTIDELGIADSATLMGITDDVEALLLRSKLSVLCSKMEGLPMVLAESMSCGVPAVTYDSSPGVREIVTDGVNGLVVPVGRVAGLANAMARLMSDDDERQQYAVMARRAASRFSTAHVMDQWEDLIARTVR
ncbi:MAG: glycosyltransferase [Terracoccus sp.]